jgi:hypothetical protein
MSIGTQNREELSKLLPPWDPGNLDALALKAGFNLQDMATWFELNKGTMRSWLRDKVAPNPAKRPALQKRLHLLEVAVALWPDKLPVPLHVNKYQRTPYVRGLLDHALKLPKSGSTK